MNGPAFRRAIRRLKKTQRELAEVLGLAKNTVARYERDELTISKVVELAVRYLRVVESKKGRER